MLSKLSAGKKTHQELCILLKNATHPAASLQWTLQLRPARQFLIWGRGIGPWYTQPGGKKQIKHMLKQDYWNFSLHLSPYSIFISLIFLKRKFSSFAMIFLIRLPIQYAMKQDKRDCVSKTCEIWNHTHSNIFIWEKKQKTCHKVCFLFKFSHYFRSMHHYL